MKERPILFSALMVRAILAGTKSQTRRVVKPLKAMGKSLAWCDLACSSEKLLRHQVRGYQEHCPYGKPGDRLWVRETYWHDDEDNSIVYRADGDTGIVDTNKHETGLARYNWRPSIFMPRAASRITLEITGVRVERLQDISEVDSIAEGVESMTGNKTTVYHWDFPKPKPNYAVSGYKSACDAYTVLWESINGPGSWEINPWVWVIEFRRID